MTTAAHSPFGDAMDALARDLAKREVDDAQAVIRDARKQAQLRWLKKAIADGDATESLDGPTVMAELLAEAEADVETTRRYGKV